MSLWWSRKGPRKNVDRNTTKEQNGERLVTLSGKNDPREFFVVLFLASPHTRELFIFRVVVWVHFRYTE